MVLTPHQWHERFAQQARWTQSSREYIFQMIDATRLPKIAEIGSGTGAVVQHLTKMRGSHKGIFSLDINLNFLKTAKTDQPESNQVCGNAFSLPFADHSLDAVYCHFLLLWLHDPLKALQEMRRVVRPGGAVMALAEPDYSGRIDHPQSLAGLGKEQAASLRNQGADPDMGRKIMGLFSATGLASVSAGVLGGQWRAGQLPDEWETEWEVMHADLQTKISELELSRLKEIDRQSWLNGARILYVPTFYVWGFSPG